MADGLGRAGGDLFVVDNSDTDWTVGRYLRDWADLAHSLDVATGFFEIGGLLALEGQWQKLDRIRLLMGDQVTPRTRRALTEGLREVLDPSIEREKETNDFLEGVPAIVEALRRGQIQARVYSKDKFHAKAYITHGRSEVVGSVALVGSSNFTKPGLSDNVELNVQVKGAEVGILHDWYDRYWQAAEEITPEVVAFIERHTREFSPFEVYARALQEYFRNYELTATDWELQKSKLYMPVLDHYQREGYQNLLKIARRWNGALLCDGVGLGKTYVGLMLIERLVDYDRKRVALFVPKGARDSVWDVEIERHLPALRGDFSNFAIFNHTDLLRKGQYQDRLARIKEQADVIIIDEAHHFRNLGKEGESRYWKLSDIAQGKQVFMLTATPVNNRLIDLMHMIDLFAQGDDAHFGKAPLGIHSLRGHFRKLDKALDALLDAREGRDVHVDEMEVTEVEAEQVLRDDTLFRALVVQRSRAYVKESVFQHGGREVVFPVRAAPQVADYSIRKTHGKLLSQFEAAFNRTHPLFTLAIYYPLAYLKGGDPEDTASAFERNRQKQVVGLIRTQFLKRFESSQQAFEVSCNRLLLKLMTWLEVHAQSSRDSERYEGWKARWAQLTRFVQNRQLEFFGDGDDEEADEDLITEEMLEEVEPLDPPEDYRISDMVTDTLADLDVLAGFLSELAKLEPKDDDKLKALIRLLKGDAQLKQHKVLIFSEYADTARYVHKELVKAGFAAVEQVDSGTKRPRADIIKRFAPYYNGSSSAALQGSKPGETRILISTDVLSEGLNLQDATLLINYDLHWNPVRLMQRIGRVDRRLNPEVETRLVGDHPEEASVRGKVRYWNFLPPGELAGLLHLYTLVTNKTLRISKTFGIEGRKLLKPDDDYEALKEFNQSYEGTATSTEQMHLEYQQLLKDHPGLESRLNDLPLRIFSGKQRPSPGSAGVFFCYALPAQDLASEGGVGWTFDAGYTRWYLYELASGEVSGDPGAIVELIRSRPDSVRMSALPPPRLSEIRAEVDKHIKNSYLKQVNAPLTAPKPSLRCWMELVGG